MAVFDRLIDICFLQDKDLKQYMDDCGNIMSMHNVKVRITVTLLIFYRNVSNIII